ncbi:MAG: hypothetical protein QM767_07355 [Anaeromyxobacter sp.]
MTSLTRLRGAQSTFIARNHGGAFTTGYVVLFTDGSDTAARVSAADATSAEDDGPEQVIAVGLKSAEYDGEALAKLAPYGVITASDSTQLAAAFTALTDRIEGQVSRSYLLGYCSPKRAGTAHEVTVEILGADNQASPAYEFDASAFTPGCSTASFATLCDGMACGGLGCGACDDRQAACDPATWTCADYCMTAQHCDGSTYTNPLGYSQVCTEGASNSSCGGACVDTRVNPDNCGTCGHACATGQRCASSACVN